MPSVSRGAALGKDLSDTLRRSHARISCVGGRGGDLERVLDALEGFKEVAHGA